VKRRMWHAAAVPWTAQPQMAVTGVPVTTRHFHTLELQALKYSMGQPHFYLSCVPEDIDTFKTAWTFQAPFVISITTFKATQRAISRYTSHGF